jgi:hypothetical protein
MAIRALAAAAAERGTEVRSRGSLAGAWPAQQVRRTRASRVMNNIPIKSHFATLKMRSPT